MSDLIRQVVLPLLDGVKPSAGGYVARCPAHPDTNPSLSIGPGRDQPVMLHCHAGCDPADILAAVGLTWEEISKPRDVDRSDDRWTPAGPAVAIYGYRDETGKLLFQVLRTASKDFRQRIPDPTTGSGWRWSLGDTRRVPYRLPELLDGVAAGEPIYIVEGEKDVESLVRAGVYATCNPGGAGKWLPEFAEHLRDAHVMIISDRDAPGQAHARKVRDTLDGIAAQVTIAEPATGKDITDHLDAGLSLADLEITWAGEDTSGPQLAPTLREFLAAGSDPYDWVIPGLIERGDRLILTGFEGLGKSMLIRQLCLAPASGMHPFTRTYFEPRRVLLIDCENSERQSRRRFEPMAEAMARLGGDAGLDNLRLIHRPSGLDLTRAEDAEWLLERVTAHKPDLLSIGPFYRLHAKDMNEEGAARQVASVLDQARIAGGCALITEAHAGHGQGGQSRSVRPAGSSLLLRWPEFGYGLSPAGPPPEPGQRPEIVNLATWRGPRDDRDWPAMLRYGGAGQLPWRGLTQAEIEQISR